MEKTCRFGHICTSGCQKDFDCPCQDLHCCAMSENCEGKCDDCFQHSDLADLVNDNLNER